MSEQKKNMMVTILTFVFGILFSVIGFFGAFTLSDIKEEIKCLRFDLSSVKDSCQMQSKINNIQDYRLSLIESRLSVINKEERNKSNEKLENNSVWRSVNYLRNR